MIISTMKILDTYTKDNFAQLPKLLFIDILRKIDASKLESLEKLRKKAAGSWSSIEVLREVCTLSLSVFDAPTRILIDDSAISNFVSFVSFTETKKAPINKTTGVPAGYSYENTLISYAFLLSLVAFKKLSEVGKEPMSKNEQKMFLKKCTSEQYRYASDSVMLEILNALNENSRVLKKFEEKEVWNISNSPRYTLSSGLKPENFPVAEIEKWCAENISRLVAAKQSLTDRTDLLLSSLSSMIFSYAEAYLKVRTCGAISNRIAEIKKELTEDTDKMNLYKVQKSIAKTGDALKVLEELQKFKEVIDSVVGGIKKDSLQPATINQFGQQAKWLKRNSHDLETLLRKHYVTALKKKF